ncbi:acyltransferase family protein [Owenweeksia hongkongensis DSM 17368]|uniref:Acyltransferase family protein n=1 Tax=Owenweeksia hongkongensis (strain DSM 17368 / CIP 108786 / JCM 12287 / NRRL B-23963 / UST20020801) TaxID=926562 RepID=G8R4U7_OWEHD|nr:acyltransferase [Owenweeksia hongkongensis]AEV34261.1 acyltransferase family protein [Owenweeksia hongkongensis DSM 17368]
MFKRVRNLFRWYFMAPEKYARHVGVKMGERCRIATKYWGSEPYLIEIGNHVQVTEGVKFFNHGGGWVFREKHPKLDTFGKIRVGNNVYIGNNAIILPGVSISDNVIVGAGAVVTKSILEGDIVAGNPAKVVGTVRELESKILKYNVNTKGLTPDQKKAHLLSLDNEWFLKK